LEDFQRLLGLNNPALGGVCEKVNDNLRPGLVAELIFLIRIRVVGRSSYGLS
jgi:hypothetical protein